MDPDLTLSPDESLGDLDMDDMNDIDNDESYYNYSDLFSDSDYLDDIDDDDDDDDDSDTPVKDSVTHKTRNFKSWLKDIIDPLKRAKSKLIRAKAKHLKSIDKNEHLKLKLGAKKVGLLSLAALAIKMMIDHHQDKITSDNEKTLLKLYADSKKRVANGKKKGQPVDPLLLSMSHVNKSDINKVLNDANDAIGTTKSLVNTNYNKVGQQATTFGKSWLTSLANSFGIDIHKFGQAFQNLVGMFKGI